MPLTIHYLFYFRPLNQEEIEAAAAAKILADELVSTLYLTLYNSVYHIISNCVVLCVLLYSCYHFNALFYHVFGDVHNFVCTSLLFLFIGSRHFMFIYYYVSLTFPSSFTLSLHPLIHCAHLIHLFLTIHLITFLLSSYIMFLHFPSLLFSFSYYRPLHPSQLQQTLKCHAHTHSQSVSQYSIK